MITSHLCPCLPPPAIFAGEQDVGPSERRDMREQSGIAIQPGPLPRCDGLAQMIRSGSAATMALDAEEF